MQKAILLFVIVSFLGCSQVPQRSIEIQAPQSSTTSERHQKTITVAVVGINDFHGSLLPRERKLPNGEVIQSGGAATLFSMIKRLREEMNENVLVVDAGDEWQGTLESNSVKGATVVDFYNQLGVKVAAIGNHEFDFNLETLKKRVHEARYPYVASNIFEKKNHKRIQWENVLPSTLIEVGGIQFGVIGVSTTQTPSTTRYENVKHLDFVNPLQGVESESAKLRKIGANAVLVTAHAGTECANSGDLKEWKLRSARDAQASCDSDQEIHRLADQVKPETLDGMVAGHTHQIIHHFFNSIPVVEGQAYNQYFNIIYYTFDAGTHQLLKDLTRIEGVIPICSEHFVGQNHCDVSRLAGGVSPKRVRARFHGQEVIPDPSIEAWLTPITETTKAYKNEVLAESVLPLDHFREKESPFGNLIADVLRAKGKADFALVNSGGIRTSLDAGPITYDGIFRALPFDNLLKVVELSGAQVKMLYRIATSGPHGTVGLSGLELVLKPFQQEAERSDLNGDGKLETWETNRLVSIKTSEGKEIDDHKRYRVATFDFLLSGGDDLGWFMREIPTRMISRENFGFCRDLITDYLKKTKVINTLEHPLVDSKHPRIRFQSK